MRKILSFEADRRAINITINSFGPELSKERRAKLFPTVGLLFPEGNNNLARADDVEQVRAAVEYIPEYRSFFEASSQSSTRNGDADGYDHGLASHLEDRFFAQEVHLNKLAFLQQFSYAGFYSYIKLKEQEVRNLTWIAECIAQNNRERIGEYISTF